MLLSRRRFCAGLGSAIGFAPWISGSSTAASAEPPKKLTVIAYNVYVCKGWPDDRASAEAAVASGELPRRLADELARYRPDIVNFSESPSEAAAQRIAERLGMHHVRFPSGGNWPGTLLSRYPLSDVKNAPVVGGKRPADLFTRHWGQATVTLPDGETIVVHSAHLHPADDPAVRLREVPAMLESMKADLAADRNLLLIGDLNHRPDAQEYRLWREAGLVDTFADQGSGEGLTFKAGDLHKRIDYIFAAGPLARRITAARALDEGAFQLQAGDADGFALSDHLPQWAEFARRP